jgi:hypothetical protein
VVRHLFAVIVLLLAMSPFTAPFQTCDIGQPVAIAVTSHDDDAGSIVAPLVSKAPHLLIAPPAPIYWSKTHPCVAFVPLGWTASLRERPPDAVNILRI